MKILKTILLTSIAALVLSACGKKFVLIKDASTPIFTEDKVVDYANQGDMYKYSGEKDELYIIEIDGEEYYVDKTHCRIISDQAEADTPKQAEEQTNDNPAPAPQGANGDSPLLKTYTKQCTTASGATTNITYRIADQDDHAQLYSEPTNKENIYFVISKIDYRIYVYEKTGNGVSLVAHYPICYAKKSGAKECEGDMKTPESIGDTPFEISEIKDASTWCHDFNDGRGEFLAYGAWFMRLKLNGTPLVGNRSIGIHGSTNNAESVPGQDSEGCIRLRDADIMQLKEKFAQVGTKVFIRSNQQGKTAPEKEAVKRLGNRYYAPQPGNPLLRQ